MTKFVFMGMIATEIKGLPFKSLLVAAGVQAWPRFDVVDDLMRAPPVALCLPPPLGGKFCSTAQ